MKFLRYFTYFSIIFLAASCSKSSDKFAKKWSASEIELNGITFKKNDLGSFTFDLKSDGSFEYIEKTTDNKVSTEKGTWSASDDGKTITLKYPDREVKQTVVSAENATLIVDFNDHGMQRKMTLQAE